MCILTHPFRVLSVVSLCVTLFALPSWAQQQSYGDTEDDSALTSQDVEDESYDGEWSFERELADIEAQYSQLVPDHAKNTAITEAPNDVDDEDESEDEEEE